jgi:hypothetical protein
VPGAARREPVVRRGHLPSAKVAIAGIVLASLVGLLAFSLFRELGGGRSSSRPPGARPVLTTPRPALTAEQEAYAQALWPIHNEVKAGALKMTMSGIQYKTNTADAAALRSQVMASMETYRQAERQVLELKPPRSLEGVHDDYLAAVRLYLESGAEMIKLSEDNRDDHLVAAFPLSQEGGKRIRAVGAVLWPSEYVPN